MTRQGLRFGPLGDGAVHLCVDMQRIFAEPTPWFTPWMDRVLPTVVRVARRHAERTVFTRFVPVRRPEDAAGAWRRYYDRWRAMTLEEIEPALIDLVPDLRAFVPPARTLDKSVYSPWTGTMLHAGLRRRKVDTVVITGGETDVCVLATAMGAVDLGYRTVLVHDALCSSSDEMHDALLSLYARRFGRQVETADADEVLSSWRA